MHRAIVGIFAVALGLFSAAPALAASQQVQVADNSFMPSAVAVKPGESVTWTNPGPTAGTGDLHNVNFEDGMFRGPDRPLRGPWGPETRTFNTEGAYRYFCQEHGGPGGSGMSGIVFVNATGTFPGAPPVASFTVSPNPAVVGQVVSFNATGSSEPDPGEEIVKYEWDLDGNGTFETDSGATPMTSRLYAQPGQVNVKLRVTDTVGVTGETSRLLTVNAAPVSSFTASPTTAQTGQPVTFDGGASTDSDGTIVKYEWDLDGDGSFETNTGTTPTTSRSYSAPGALNVKLRVTDDDGLTGETTRSVQIDAPPAAIQQQPGGQPQILPTPTPVFTPPAPVTCNSLTGPKRAACIQKTTCSKLKGSKRARCIQKSCRSTKGSARAPCIRKSCRYLKRSKRAACKLKSCSTLTGAKKRACVRKYAPRAPRKR